MGSCSAKAGFLTASIKEMISLLGAWTQSYHWPRSQWAISWRFLWSTINDINFNLRGRLELLFGHGFSKDSTSLHQMLITCIVLDNPIRAAVVIKESAWVWALGVHENYFLSKPRPHHSGGGRAGYTGIKLPNPGILGENYGNQLIHLRARL